jgi:hypothetical protein
LTRIINRTIESPQSLEDEAKMGSMTIRDCKVV